MRIIPGGRKARADEEEIRRYISQSPPELRIESDPLDACLAGEDGPSLKGQLR